MRIITMWIGLAALTGFPAWGQTAAADKQAPVAQAAPKAAKNFYQLTFVAREMEGERVINSRSYSIIMRSDTERGAIRAGEKVPFASTSGANTQWQQVDIGINIDCRRVEEVGDRLSLSLTAAISSMIEDPHENASSSAQPIIRDNRWESTVVVPLRQATVLFSSDDLGSKRKMQLELTVLPLH